MRKLIPFVLIAAGILSVVHIGSQIRRRAAAEQQFNSTDAVRGQLAAATGGERGTPETQTKSNPGSLADQTKREQLIRTFISAGVLQKVEEGSPGSRVVHM